MTCSTAELPAFVDEVCVALANAGQEHLRRLGFTGTVVVNVEWTENPRNGYFAIASKIPSGATAEVVPLVVEIHVAAVPSVMVTQ